MLIRKHTALEHVHGRSVANLSVVGELMTGKDESSV